MKVILVSVILLGLLVAGACDRGKEEFDQVEDSDRDSDQEEIRSEDTRESLNSIGWQEEARSIRDDVEVFSQDFMYRIDNLSSMEEWDLAMEELNEAVDEIYDAIDELHEASDELFNVQENLFEVRQAVWELEQEYIEWEETTQTDDENEISDGSPIENSFIGDLAGIYFEIYNPGSAPALVSEIDGSVYGLSSSAGPFLDAAFKNVRIILEQVGSSNERKLWITFDPSDGAVQYFPVPTGWSMGNDYDNIRQGDRILIDEERRVFVNGELRQPR